MLLAVVVRASTIPVRSHNCDFVLRVLSLPMFVCVCALKGSAFLFLQVDWRSIRKLDFLSDGLNQKWPVTNSFVYVVC